MLGSLLLLGETQWSAVSCVCAGVCLFSLLGSHARTQLLSVSLPITLSISPPPSLSLCDFLLTVSFSVFLHILFLS